MRMKRAILILLIGLGSLFMTVPLFAQNGSGEFGEILKAELDVESSSPAVVTSTKADPPIGSADQLGPSRLSPVGTGDPYDAGRDRMSGFVAVGAALLAAVVVLLMLVLVVVTGGGRSESDSS